MSSFIRPSTDIDLCVTSLLDAMGKLAHRPVLLRVHADMFEWTRRLLILTYGSPKNSETLIAVTNGMEYDWDAWMVSDGETTFFSPGA